MNDENLEDLFDLIASRGRWNWLQGAGLHTHPHDSDLHAACLELERRGRVERTIDELGICWKVKRDG